MHCTSPSFPTTQPLPSQVVWKATTEVGCGFANCAGGALVVCEYAPPGNVLGEFTTNV